MVNIIKAIVNLADNLLLELCEIYLVEMYLIRRVLGVGNIFL